MAFRFGGAQDRDELRLRHLKRMIDLLQRVRNHSPSPSSALLDPLNV
jgi:hypothetical protein